MGPVYFSRQLIVGALCCVSHALYCTNPVNSTITPIKDPNQVLWLEIPMETVLTCGGEAGGCFIT